MRECRWRDERPEMALVAGIVTLGVEMWGSGGGDVWTPLPVMNRVKGEFARASGRVM